MNKKSNLCAVCGPKMRAYVRGELSKAPEICPKCKEFMKNRFEESRYASRERPDRGNIDDE